MNVRSRKLITKRLRRAFFYTTLTMFVALNWFARLPQDRQQKTYSHLPQYLAYKLYYFSNLSASMTDFLGITGHDSVVDYQGTLPVRNLVVGGYPKPEAHRRVAGGAQYLMRVGFTVCYSPELRHPLWVANHVPAGGRLPESPRPPFKRDPEALNSPAPGDYAKTGYDRGHMAPNRAISTCHGAEAQKQSFLLSNICPQKPGLNRGPWRKIEHLITDVWPSKYGDLWVITGAYNSSESKRLPSGIAIPDGFYKIIVAHKNNKLRVLALYMPQESGYGVFPRTKIISVDELEILTGVDFLADLPDEIESQLEAEKPTRLWPAGWRGNIKLLISLFTDHRLSWPKRHQ
ncbi:MAG: DNA/RNA non-specific endonuclease [Kiritimatiellae bacterium]|nr:DNA/RNA non-specific endonuclease [Kiritimatiellia bacterium]